MKRILLLHLALLLVLVNLQAQVSCASFDYEQEQLRIHPDWGVRLRQWESGIGVSGEPLSGASGVSPVMTLIRIPVVVHILYRDNPQLVTDEQVHTQIDALNLAFRKLTPDTLRTPLAFRSLSADCFIEFELAHVDPEGYETTGIIRKKTSILNFNVDDRIKKSDQGGDDAWDADRYLNIWVGVTAGGIIGYSSLPGGDKQLDGIVIRHSAFGSEGTVPGPYNKGRTAVHEIGHWLGLRHIWGDSYCGNDGIDDTPPQRSGTYGCPSGVVISCDNDPTGNMYMNYMDVTYDACTNLFTLGQRSRMRSMFAEGGPRHALLSSNALTAVPLPRPVGSALPGGDVDAPQIKLLPNPAATEVQVWVSPETITGETRIYLYSRLGQQLMVHRVTGTQTRIPLTSLSDGLYFIRVGEKGKALRLLKLSAAGAR